MNETAFSLPELALVRARMDRTASDELAARTGHQARAIASLLDGIGSQDPATAGIVAYLRSYADSTEPLGSWPRHSTPLDLLAERYRLTEIELDALVLAGLGDQHEGLASTLRHLHPLGEPRPSLGLLCQLHAAQVEDRFDVEAVLYAGNATRGGLVRVDGPGTRFERSLHLPDALWGALQGHDGSWPGSVERISLDVPISGLDEWLGLDEVRAASLDLKGDTDVTLVMVSPDESIAVSRLAALASRGTPMAAVRLGVNDHLGRRLAAAHAAARGATLAVFLAVDPASPTVSLDVTDHDGPLIVVTTGHPVTAIGRRPVRAIPIGPMSMDARREGWRASLGIREEEAARLTARHPVDPAIAALVAADLGRYEGCPMDAPAVSAAIRSRIGLVLPAGCELLSPRVGWQRLVVPEDAATQLRDAVERVENQGTVLDDWGVLEGARANRGVRLLFTGPPGTGKSLAAEVVASELGTDLLVVDLAQIVSKWLGETERNLGAVFDAAQRSQAVLRFDEADALFAQRTGVSSSNDRYANLETGYVLQRLDRFDGLAILTTNLKQNIDRAFLRRMDAIVDFGLPDADQRLRLWQVHLPDAVPVSTDVDLDALASRYDIAGAWIRNAVIAAAFLAAAGPDPKQITQRHLTAAISREYAKAARPMPGSG